MAVPSSSPTRSKSSSKEPEVAAENGEVAGDGESQRKRTKDPGVRVVGGRIYCSANGKSCHQCRQKTLDFAAECKNMKGSKQCTIKFCHKCLKNRYGEEASDVANSEDWECPKCRGICNCSVCMKKRGHHPTGILVHTAKKTGFTSVSEMLNLGSPSKVVNDVDQFTKKSPASNKEICNGSRVDDVSTRDKPLSKKVKGQEKYESARKAKTKRKLHVLENDSTKEEDKSTEGRRFNVDEEITAESILKNCSGNLQNKVLPVEVPLPQGIPLTTVAGVDLPAEAVGDALQLLEFCAAFGKVLDLRKGQAESLLRELVSARRRRNGQASVIVHFHTLLLSFIEGDFEEESSVLPTNGKQPWLTALGEFASRYRSALGEFPMDCFDRGAIGYEKLDISKKLRLLIFLCDEVLSTEIFRTWIEEQNTKSNEDGKETKEKLLAAKTKEKLLKQKLQNELAEAIIARNGVPLSISEHEAIVFQVKDELARARADVLQEEISNKRQGCDAVRTQPLFQDFNGHTFWKLNSSCGESNILLQELGKCDSVGCGEKWFIYEPEKKESIDEYISLVRVSRRQRIRENHPLAFDAEQQQHKVMA